MTSPRWPVVIFDLDGTLADSVPLIVASYQHAFTTVLGQPHDPDEIKTWIGQSLYGAFVRVAPDRADELFAAYTTWNEANTERLLRPFPGVPELAQALVSAGVRTGVATSKREAPAAWALRLCGIADTMPLLVHHDSVAHHKPAPDALLLAAARVDAAPDACVYVGDAAVDVLAARHAGMAAIACTWGAGTRADIEAAGPDAVCESVADLRRLLVGADAAAAH